METNLSNRNKFNLKLIISLIVLVIILTSLPFGVKYLVSPKIAIRTPASEPPTPSETLTADDSKPSSFPNEVVSPEPSSDQIASPTETISETPTLGETPSTAPTSDESSSSSSDIADSPTSIPSNTSASSSTLIADINSDGVLDLKDYDLLTSVFGTGNAAGDLNHDGIVNIQDYIIISNNFRK